MKQAIIIAIIILLGFTALSVAEAVGKYDISRKIAEIGANAERIDVYLVPVSATTTCYVTVQGKYGSHAISCVR